MEVAPPGLPGLPPDVALWLLELREGLGLPALPWARQDHPPPLLRSSTLEDLSVEGPAMDAPRQEDSDDDSDRSVDSLEEEVLVLAVHAGGAPPSKPLPPPPHRDDDMLARLSGGECRALPAVLEEDEDDLTQDEEEGDEEESVTVLQAMGWIECPPPARAAPPPRRSVSAGTLATASTSTSPAALGRTSSAPQLLPSSPTPSSSPTLTPATGSPCVSTFSTSTACAEALESAEALCRDLMEEDEDLDRTLSQSVSVDDDLVFDDEFLALCSEANRLVETCLYPTTDPGSTGGPVPRPRPVTAADLAPDLAPPRPKFDINSIFDHGGPEPPQPPARKRRKALADQRARERQLAPEFAPEFAPESTPEPPLRQRLERRLSESGAVAERGAPSAVSCLAAELLLMTRASERTQLKRSRSVSAADQAIRQHVDPDQQPEPTLALFASSPELRSPPSPQAAQRGLVLAPDARVPRGDHPDDRPVSLVTAEPEGCEVECGRGRRKNSVSSDVVAWQGDLLWAGLSDGEDAEGDALSCLETKQWFSSTDNKGRVYFFEENSCESSWILPDVNSSVTQESTFEDEGCRQVDDPVLSSTPRDDERDRHVKPERSEKQEKLSLRTTKSRSMVIVDSGVNKDIKNIPSPRNWPKLLDDGDMCVLKEGPMYRTKITENGKKLRKNWASSHVVLTELFLLLFRDVKAFAAMKSSNQNIGGPRPELCVDLNGALIDQVDRGDKASVTSRKNVFLVSTVLGLQVLFQCDCSQQAEEWFNAVHTAIHNLPSGFDSCPRLKVTKEMDRLFAESHSPEQTKKFPRIGRSKSVKIKNKDGSIEDLTVSVAERQTKIRARLKKFFNRRPTMEFLVKKGIWKDEPAFGSYLEQVCGSETPKVPMFVQRCIAVIESIEENMKTDGLYRVSGNLSQVQKIRLQVDQNNLSALDQEEDVHVLTGALKLFFRELKEPLIPYAAFSKAIKASTLQNKKEKLAQFREIVKSLPTANHDTLKMLLKHLLKVTGYQEFNRMHIPNLAIVFGPTLMWPEQESLNMALDLMQQNLVIEAFLLDFDNIFR